MTTHNNVVLYLVLILTTVNVILMDAFVVVSPSNVVTRPHSSYIGTRSIDKYNNKNVVALNAVKKKRRRRKKKDSDGGDSSSSSTGSSQTSSKIPLELTGVEGLEQEQENVKLTEEDLKKMKEIADFTFDGSITKDGETMKVVAGSESTDVIPLPDIKDALRTKKDKKEKEELEIQEEQKKEARKVKRSDSKAVRDLMEEIPFADADATLFVEEEYGTVSALLGEGAKSFLGIPPGPLQVGHFIGALVIVLIAYVEYPGFPLTNLPTPLRDCFQGGLFTIYTINFVLAIISTFKASERGQSKILWALKTFSVGGLAYDQLTQLPTLKEIDEIKNRKGARALKKK